MNLIKFVAINKKRIVGTSLLLSLLFAQSAGAAASVSDSIVSKGNIEYDADSDGKADVYFYSKDLSTIATGIDALNVDISTMEVAMTQLANTTTKYKTDIISGLNNSVYAKSNISSSATFEDIIQKINNIPAPTTAIGKYYNAGNNDGLGVGLSSSTTSANVNIDGVTTLNLGINEAITLPSGYYPNDITIQNNVANRGSATANTTLAGYYNGINITPDISEVISGSAITVEDIKINGLYANPYTEYKMTKDGFVYGYVRAANYEIDSGRTHDIGKATGYCYIYSKTGEKLYTVDEFSNISAYHDSKKQMYYLHEGDYIRIYVHTQGRDPYENTGAFIGSVIYLN